MIHKLEELIFFVYLGALSISDIRTKSVPYWGLGIGVFLVVGIRLCEYKFGGSMYGWNELVGMIPGIVLMFVAYVTKSAGSADGIVCLIIGLYRGGKYSVSVLCTALFLAAICGALGMLLRKWDKNKKIPFIPFMFLACFLAEIV